jgi:hypothetical protein
MVETFDDAVIGAGVRGCPPGRKRRRDHRPGRPRHDDLVWGAEGVVSEALEAVI